MANIDIPRQIYNVLGAFVSPSPGTGYMFSSGTSGVNLLSVIPRTQSANVSLTINRDDVNEYGILSRLDTVINTPPNVGLTLDYLLLDGYAESILGFAASGQQSFVSGMIDGTQSEKNYFLGVAPPGTDLIGYNSPTNVNVIGIGNGYVSNYSINLAVGQIPKASISIEASNLQFYTGSSGNSSPAIDPNTALPVVGPTFSLPTMIAYTGANVNAALRVGDLVLAIPRNASLGDYASGVGQIHVNAVTISVPLALDPITILGNPYPISRPIKFPVNCTMTVNALAADVNPDSVANLFCSDVPYNLAVSLRNPNCSRTGNNAITYYFNQAKLTNRAFSSSIGQNSTVSLTFTNQLGGISSSYLGQGVVVSGSFGQASYG